MARKLQDFIRYERAGKTVIVLNSMEELSEVPIDITKVILVSNNGVENNFNLDLTRPQTDHDGINIIAIDKVWDNDPTTWQTPPLAGLGCYILVTSDYVELTQQQVNTLFGLGWYMGARGLFGGGLTIANVNTIDQVIIATASNATNFGNLTQARQSLASCSNGTIGLFGGGFTTTNVNTVDQVTIPTSSNATNFGNLTIAKYGLASCSNGTIGIFGGGRRTVNLSTIMNNIDQVIIATNSNATDFGDLTVARSALASCSNGTIGIFGGGRLLSSIKFNIIDQVIIATSANAINFGALTQARDNLASCSNGTIGIFGGGRSGTNVNTIDQVIIATSANATDFGDLISARRSLASCSNGTTGIFGGGFVVARVGIIDQVTIATQSNATGFGNLTIAKYALASCSGA